jgi:hypothetical protein
MLEKYLLCLDLRNLRAHHTKFIEQLNLNYEYLRDRGFKEGRQICYWKNLNVSFNLQVGSGLKWVLNTYLFSVLLKNYAQPQDTPLFFQGDVHEMRLQR